MNTSRLILLVAMLPLAARPCPAGEPEVPASLTLHEALELALSHNPRLAGSDWEIRAREAEALQAGLWPNPALELESEGVGGTGDLSGTDAAETTLLLSQPIELAGKIGKRKRVAELEKDLAGWDYESVRLEVFSDVTGAFAEVLANQERVRLASEQVEVAGRALNTARERVRSGKVSPVDETRARVQRASAAMELSRRERELLASRARLAAAWGSTGARFERVEGDLYTLFPVPPLSDLMVRAAANPAIARWQTEIGILDARLALERARAVPDLELGAGIKHENEVDDVGFVLALSIPLPLFDRNQGAVQAADSRRSQAEQAARAAEVEIAGALASEYELLTGARTEAETLREQVLPDAESAFQSVRDAYELGKLDYLDVLDAQTTLFETRSRYLEALAEFHASAARVERLIASPLREDSPRFPQARKESEHE